MKKFILFLLIVIGSACDADTDIIDNVTYSGNYTGLVSWENLNSGRIHMSPLNIRIVESVVNTTEDNVTYRVNSDGFGSIAIDTRELCDNRPCLDTLFVEQRINDSTVIIVDTLLSYQLKTEQVQIGVNRVNWESVIQMYTTGKQMETIVGKGVLNGG